MKLSSRAALLNDPFIATTPYFNIGKQFDSHGIIKIDLSQVNLIIRRGFDELPRTSAGYHYSVWRQEISLFGSVPQEAIIDWIK